MDDLRDAVRDPAFEEGTKYIGLVEEEPSKIRRAGCACEASAMD